MAKAKTKPMSERMERKQEFIKALAKYLVGNQALKSIALEMESKNPPFGPQWATEWAEVRSRSPIHGWADLADVEAQLTDFLW